MLIDYKLTFSMSCKIVNHYVYASDHTIRIDYPVLKYNHLVKFYYRLSLY
jgi:hypothetical protein